MSLFVTGVLRTLWPFNLEALIYTLLRLDNIGQLSFVRSARHAVKYIEMYLNTNTFNLFKYKYRFPEFQMYFNANPNALESI